MRSRPSLLPGRVAPMRLHLCALLVLLSVAACRTVPNGQDPFPTLAEPELDQAIGAAQRWEAPAVPPQPDEPMPDETLPSTEGALDSLGVSWEPIPEANEEARSRNNSGRADAGMKAGVQIDSAGPARGYASLFLAETSQTLHSPESPETSETTSTSGSAETPSESSARQTRVGASELQASLLSPSLAPETGLGMNAEREASLSSQLAMAWRAYYDESPASARPLFEALAVSVPDRADIQLGMGLCLLADNALDEAEKRFTLAHLLAPSDPQPLFYQGVMRYQRGQYEAALAQWQPVAQALEHVPTGSMHRDLAWLQARALLALGRLAEGEAAFQRALALGGLGAGGRLNPPDPTLEWSVSNQLPGGDFQPVGGRKSLNLKDGLVFSVGGSLWRMTGQSLLRKRLTHPPAGWQDDAGVPEPRGARLLILSRDPAGQVQLILQQADGSRQTLVTGPVMPVPPTWSPDGTLVGFVMAGGEPRLPRLYLLRLSSGDLEPIFWPEGPVRDPAFATSGQLMMAVQSPQSTQLVRWRLGEPRGEPVPFVPMEEGTDTSASPDASTPPSQPSGMESSPSPDSRAALIRRSPPTPPPPPMRLGEPWHATPSVSEPRTPTRRTVEGNGTPSGTSLRPTTTGHAGASPLVNRALQKAPQELEPKPLYGDRVQPAIAPGTDGLRFAYVRPLGHLRRVILHEPDARRDRGIGSAQLDCHSPAFSPDGQRLAFLCRDGDLQRLYVYDRQTETVQRLFDEPLSVSAPAWSWPGSTQSAPELSRSVVP